MADPNLAEQLIAAVRNGPDNALKILANNEPLRTLARSRIVTKDDEHETLELSILRKASLATQVNYLEIEDVREAIYDKGTRQIRQLVRDIYTLASRAGIRAAIPAKPPVLPAARVQLG